ncbi:GNAT family N-acetyltransferase [Psychrobacillus vulpis]|uniref:GNAT family N-acetyltransferase n=1 Tax=Psychrobacillus vulpis TaxID=2325572 RepID=A0A544TT34_9BACI|nr:GNAT family N-acetyltransferase [Psychrobacillus vulpis]TQR20618.1 GNAT family N-acetyltransferase [Psychrobacillus vulpis]
MSFVISSPKDIEKLALFLEEMNSKRETHIGYCGEQKQQIYATLISDFSDLDLARSFVIAYVKDEIIGALGLDIDEESKSAEVWGPFIKNRSEYLGLADELWEKVIELSRIEMNEFSFFVNEENSFAKDFAINKGAVNKGNYFVLKAFRNDLKTVDLTQIETYSLLYKNPFTNLHDTSFPNTYYSASEIVYRINDHNQLLVMLDNERKLTGYVYVEGDPEHKEGSIEYIAVIAGNRKQGIGTKLVRAALAHLFSFEEIEEITLSVAKNNERAINLYKAAGFKEVHELTYYVWNK